jgi:hypothetical protein
MAITQIEKEQKSNRVGLEKVIRKGSEKMVFDIAQRTMYQKPIESIVRELTSNAKDSQIEKEIALDILENNAPVSKYYIARDGDKYQDSQFKADYYDVKHLNKEKNHIDLIYTENSGVGFCDTFEIVDYGVGISPERMELILSIGGSTKRNTKKALGAWGLGAKVGLSLGDFYVLETVYNGKKYRVQCSNYGSHPIIPKFNESGEMNKTYVFGVNSNGEEVAAYYEETDELNYSKVIIPTKTAHRDKFRDAVESQLLYFKNVHLHWKDENTTTTREINFSVTPYYNSRNIIISNSYYYNKPHIVIVKDLDDDNEEGVNYGFIDFLEMDMEQLYGSIGVKCPIRSVVIDEKTGQEIVLQEGVETIPSRESIIWNEHSKEFIKKQFEAVKLEAEEYLQSKLNSTSFKEWLESCSSVTSSSGDSVINSMSRIIDKSSLTLKYDKDKSIRFYQDIRKFFDSRFFNLDVYFYSSIRDTFISVDKLNWYDFTDSTVYLKDENRNDLKYSYISKKLINSSNIPIISFREDLEFRDKSSNESQDAYDAMSKQFDKDYTKAKKIWNLYSESFDLVPMSSITVPDDFIEDVKAQELVKEQKSMSEEERRKTLGATFFRAVRLGEVHTTQIHGFSNGEIKISDLDTTKTVYYGTQEDETKLIYAAELLENSKVGSRYYSDFSPRQDRESFVKVASNRLKDFKKSSNCKPIAQFFTHIENGKISMGDSYKKYLTYKVIEDEGGLDSLNFVRNFEHISPEIYNIYKEVRTFYNNYYSFIRESRYKDDTSLQLFKHSLNETFKNVLDFQVFLDSENPTKEEVANKSLELFSVDSVQEAEAIDLLIYKKYKFLKEWAEPIQELLNSVQYSESLEKSIKEYVKFKNCHNYTIPEEFLVEETVEETVEIN